MDIPADLRYTTTPAWAQREAADTLVGITAHAQEELRDVVFVELPKVGRVVKQGEAVAVVESVKAAFDIYAPVSGTISRVNEALAKTPQLINQECYGAGWLFAITPSEPNDFSTLLSSEDYRKRIHAGAQ
jgi:glycine cleavage system H protein